MGWLMQAPGTSRDASSLASYALGLACGTSSSFRLCLPELRLMRGHIVGPAVRCLYGCWAQPSGLLCHAGGSVTGAWVQILRAGWLVNAGAAFAVCTRPHRGVIYARSSPQALPAAALCRRCSVAGLITSQVPCSAVDHTPMRSHREDRALTALRCPHAYR